MGNSRDYVKQTTQKFLESSKMMGLEINQQKTKYMCISRTEADNSNLKVDNLTFEKFNQFKYLGVNINNTNIMYEEIKKQINKLINATTVY